MTGPASGRPRRRRRAVDRTGDPRGRLRTDGGPEAEAEAGGGVGTDGGDAGCEAGSAGRDADRGASATIPSFVIGIAGGTGAGKTTVARLVTESVDEAVTRIPMDSYYQDLGHLPFEERTSVNYDHPSAFEWDLLREHLERLLEGQPIEMPQYDFERHDRLDETVRVEPTDVVVLEGILALYDEGINDMLDLRLYVETDADVRILRRIRRDVIERGRDLEGVIEQYLSTVKPMHEQFIEPTKKRADLIIPEGANSVAINLLEEKVQAEAAGDAVASFDREAIEREVGGERRSYELETNVADDAN